MSESRYLLWSLADAMPTQGAASDRSGSHVRAATVSYQRFCCAPSRTRTDTVGISRRGEPRSATSVNSPLKRALRLCNSYFRRSRYASDSASIRPRTAPGRGGDAGASLGHAVSATGPGPNLPSDACGAGETQLPPVPTEPNDDAAALRLAAGRRLFRTKCPRAAGKVIETRRIARYVAGPRGSEQTEGMKK